MKTTFARVRHASVAATSVAALWLAGIALAEGAEDNAEDGGDSGNIEEVVGAALRRVPGLTLVQDKFVYIRGLGERYATTTLNGSQIPSPDLTRNVIPLNVFPTSIVKSLRVQKSYSPSDSTRRTRAASTPIPAAGTTGSAPMTAREPSRPKSPPAW